MCSLSIANNRVYTSNGEKKTEVSYFDVEVWGVVAENCAEIFGQRPRDYRRGAAAAGALGKRRQDAELVRISANNIHFCLAREMSLPGQRSQHPMLLVRNRADCRSRCLG